MLCKLLEKSITKFRGMSQFGVPKKKKQFVAA
jgi:hypothetical protein